jgi:hypothetical protein
MDLYAISVPQLAKMLENLDRWIEKAVEHAKKKGFDPNVYLSARLAPDQYPFVRQVQAACDSAKFPAARIAGKEPPSHPDTEQTIDELRARIAKVLEYLRSLAPEDYAGAESRLVKLPFAPGKGARGQAYLIEMALPNFYFHMVTAYAILRHNGVDLGKRDFIGQLTLEDA